MQIWDRVNCNEQGYQNFGHMLGGAPRGVRAAGKYLSRDRAAGLGLGTRQKAALQLKKPDYRLLG